MKNIIWNLSRLICNAKTTAVLSALVLSIGLTALSSAGDEQADSTSKTASTSGVSGTTLSTLPCTSRVCGGRI
ncbi:hypothetical protein [Halioxenophilus sp. WMMB6]|uniref:hypothetical protein n=1 Tax=Halioxenophilus sp. WMMB6 TaxID=3073815 RepID=UPI00295EA767|nr:hypothetical protein [Halioxenophilus sp. WMMB6]